MARLLPLDGAYSVQVEGQLGTRTYDKRRDGTIEVPARDARSLRRAGLAVPVGWHDNAVGYTCTRCVRRNYFRRCGHCGHEES